jgi:hypothetical protein
MKTVAQIPEPYRFNPWKHHLGWVVYCLERLKMLPCDEILQLELIANVREINANYVDVYTGTYSIEELILQIGSQLANLAITDQKSYVAWLGDASFRILTLDDGSEWILREGIEPARYIHFHPSRNAPAITRLHGNAWKTALVMKILNVGKGAYSRHTINDIRIKYLGLSPLKSSGINSRLTPAFRLLDKIC